MVPWSAVLVLNWFELYIEMCNALCIAWCNPFAARRPCPENTPEAMVLRIDSYLWQSLRKKKKKPRQISDIRRFRVSDFGVCTVWLSALHHAVLNNAKQQHVRASHNVVSWLSLWLNHDRDHTQPEFSVWIRGHTTVMDQPFDEYSRFTIVSKEHQAQSPTSARVLPQTHQHHSLCKRWTLKHIETPRKTKDETMRCQKQVWGTKSKRCIP